VATVGGAGVSDLTGILDGAADRGGGLAAGGGDL